MSKNNYHKRYGYLTNQYFSHHPSGDRSLQGRVLKILGHNGQSQTIVDIDGIGCIRHNLWIQEVDITDLEFAVLETMRKHPEATENTFKHQDFSVKGTIKMDKKQNSELIEFLSTYPTFEETTINRLQCEANRNQQTIQEQNERINKLEIELLLAKSETKDIVSKLANIYDDGNMCLLNLTKLHRAIRYVISRYFGNAN